MCGGGGGKEEEDGVAEVNEILNQTDMLTHGIFFKYSEQDSKKNVLFDMSVIFTLYRFTHLTSPNHIIPSRVSFVDGGFLLAWEDWGGRFNKLLPACAFFF